MQKKKKKNVELDFLSRNSTFSYVQHTIIFQTARPILYDASTVSEMIADVDRIDIVSISSQALYTNTEDTEKGELDADLNSECKYEVFLRYGWKIAKERYFPIDKS